MRKLLLVAVAALGLLASCTVTAPFAATSNTLSKDAKVGTSNYISLFGGAIMLGDAGINLAAKKAGITKISVVDTKVTNYANIYAKVETFVYGD